MTELKTMLLIAARVALIMVGLTAYDLYTVYGDPFIVAGEKGEKSILVAFEGDLNIIKYDNGLHTVEAFDAKFKQYNSGFVIKSKYVHVIGVDLGNNSYRLNVYSHNGIDTFTVYPLQGERIEPKSSVGADLSRYDIPDTTTRPEIVAGELDNMYIQMNEVHNLKKIGEVLDINVTLKVPGQSYGGVENADIQLKIVREGYTIYEDSGVSNKNGKWSTSTVLEWPYYYPAYCYDVQITAEKEGVIKTESDDFLIFGENHGVYLDEDYEWLLGNKKPTDTDRKCND